MIVRHYFCTRSLRRLVLDSRCRPACRGFATGTDAGDGVLEEVSIQKDNAITTAESQDDERNPMELIPSTRRRKDKSLKFDATVLTHLTKQHTRNTTGSYGANLAPSYHPEALLSNPPGPKDVTLELLLASQSHLGHSTSLWNPATSRYIFGIRSGIHIISLDVTAQHLRRAAKVVSGVAERGGIVLFVGTRPGFDTCVVKAAELAAPACHLFERWTPGSITNGQNILGKCRKKVLDEFDNEVEGLHEMASDRLALKPDLVVCFNPLENRVLLQECALAAIPTVGVIDTNANPTWVTYPIPANDDSLRCVQVIAGVLGRAGQEGQVKRREAANKGVITYNPDESLKLPNSFDIRGYLATEVERRAERKRTAAINDDHNTSSMAAPQADLR